VVCIWFIAVFISNISTWLFFIASILLLNFSSCCWLSCLGLGLIS
jgi:hypothetical protein